MSIYIKEKSEFDLFSAELVFFYIEDYLVFNKQGFCFYPKFEAEEYNYLELEDSFLLKLGTKKNFVDLFKKENVNIKVLCGKNGCGKSTLLNEMAGTKNRSISVKKFYLLKDKNNNFAASLKCDFFLDGIETRLCKEDYSNESHPSTWCVNHNNMQIPEFEFRKNIVKYYTENPKLYDGILDEELFTNFYVELWNFDYVFTSLINGNRKRLFKDESSIDLKNWLKNDFLSYYLLVRMQDNTYDGTVKMFEDNIKEYKTDLQTFLENFVYTSYASGVVNEIYEIQNSLLSKSFKISEIPNVEKKIKELDEKIREFLDVFDKEQRQSRFSPIEINSLLYFNGYSNLKTSCRFVNNLSDGEWRSIKFRYEIYHSMYQSDGVWWYIDEPEAFLHPEWCRTFIYDYLKAYESVKNYLISINGRSSENHFNPKKRFTLVFATHSPFLLSDLTNDYIIYLKKESGITKEIPSKKECFAGNIGEMYNTNFFMQNTIGEFAKAKLIEIIDKIDNKESVNSATLSEWKQLISKIGDDLLRNLLQDKILGYEKNIAR